MSSPTTPDGSPQAATNIDVSSGHEGSNFLRKWKHRKRPSTDTLKKSDSGSETASKAEGSKVMRQFEGRTGHVTINPANFDDEEAAVADSKSGFLSGADHEEKVTTGSDHES